MNSSLTDNVFQSPSNTPKLDPIVTNETLEIVQIQKFPIVQLHTHEKI